MCVIALSVISHITICSLVGRALGYYSEGPMIEPRMDRTSFGAACTLLAMQDLRLNLFTTSLIFCAAPKKVNWFEKDCFFRCDRIFKAWCYWVPEINLIENSS